MPQIVSDAVLDGVRIAPAQRKFRNVVDKSGMSEPVIPMNVKAEKTTEALFTACGMEGMMKLKTAVANAA